MSDKEWILRRNAIEKAKSKMNEALASLNEAWLVTSGLTSDSQRMIKSRHALETSIAWLNEVEE